MNKGIRIRICLAALILTFNSIFCFSATAEGENNYYSEKEILVVFDGEMLTFDTKPVIIDGRTLVPLRTILEALSCDVVWDAEASCVKAIRDDIVLEIKIGSPWMTGYLSDNIMTYQLDVPAMIINDRTYLPLRKIAEVFDINIHWNDKTNTVSLIKNLTRDFVIESHTYYFQNQAEWMLPEFGSGYCWVCSYAMIINDIAGNVSPVDIKSVNEQYMNNGALCYHYAIASEFGLRHVPAVDRNSRYYERFDSDYGATYIKNDEKSDIVAIQALTEALNRHPEGVMVRFEEYPHTIVAVANVQGEILFNDPAPSVWHTYSDKGGLMAVTFDKTYPAQRGLKLSDMKYIQALD